jgi:glycosyltransferase involved in cell wall biosynthesis
LGLLSQMMKRTNATVHGAEAQSTGQGRTSPPSTKSTDSSRSPLRGKRVAMVTYSPYPADPRPRRAVDALLKNGMSVDLVCLRDGPASNIESPDGIRVFRIPVTHSRGGRLTYLYQYSAFILASASILAARSFAQRYELVYVHNMPDILVLSALIPKMLGAKAILDMHDPMPELMMSIYGLNEDSLSVRMLRILEKWSFARVNAVLTVNYACKQLFARSCRPEKIGVVMNSPDNNIFTFRPPLRRETISGPANKPFVIMYHGSLVERNGLDVAVDALAAVQSIPNAELRIYGGTTPFLERVIIQARNGGVQDKVSYLGPKRLEELVLEIEKCDVGIIPNHRNPFTEINTPTRIFEYLAIGKPVIAPRTVGIEDYFNGESLFYFEPGNAIDLARTLEYVFLHRNEAIGVVERGQKVYLEHAWPHERQILIKLVNTLLLQSDCGGA